VVEAVRGRRQPEDEGQMNEGLVTGPREHRRGTRFAIMTSLLYREHGTLKWHPGSTVNVSHSGVLFRVGGAPLRPAQRVDFVFELPLNGGSPPSHVRCTGRVVRTEPGSLEAGGHAVAVSIEGYALDGRLPV
jgi:hypothetical protein